MKRTSIVAIFFLLPLGLVAQSTTVQALQKKFDGSFSLYFYKNTLRMLNQTDNKDFDEMVKNIEKMRFVMIDKSKVSFSQPDYKKLVSDYKAEQYEPIVTSRLEGRNVDVYMKDKKGSTLGTVVLVNDSTSLYVLDILGTIDVRNASKLFSSVGENSDVAQKIKSFFNKDEKQPNPGKQKGIKVE